MAGFPVRFRGSIIASLYDQRYAPAGFMLQLLSVRLIFNRYNLVGYVYLAAWKTKLRYGIELGEAYGLYSCAFPALYYTFRCTIRRDFRVYCPSCTNNNPDLYFRPTSSTCSICH